MPKETATLPSGNYIIADPDYFSEYEPYLFFWTNGDGAFFDNLDNCYYVDSARIAVFEVEEIPHPLPEGTHSFVFKKPWTIDFDTNHLLEQIQISTS